MTRTEKTLLLVTIYCFAMFFGCLAFMLFSNTPNPAQHTYRDDAQPNQQLWSR